MTSVPLAAIGYLTAALAFLVLAVVTLVRWRNRPSGLWVVLAALLSVGWAGYLGFLAWQYGTSAAISGGVMEVARNAGWFALLLALLAGSGSRPGVDPRALRWWASGVAVFLLFILVPMLWPQLLGAIWPGLATLLMAIAGLVLVEQVYRNTPPQNRWEIKFLCLGLGGLFAFDLFLFADLVLFQTIDSPSWQARGFVNALVVPLLAISVSRRLPQREGPTVSRHLLFHTASLIGAGLYLLAVGGAGYYLRHHGGDLGALLQVTLLFGAVLLLAVVLFSGSVRAQLRVWLAKHFFNYRYDYRQEWLRFTGTLAQTDDETPFRQRAIQAIGELVESPGGLLWVHRDDGRFALDGVLNLGEPAYPALEPDDSLVVFLMRTGWVIDIDEFRRDPAFYHGLELPAWLVDNPRHWAVVPLLKSDGLEGFVVLAQPRARHRIDWEERDLLKTAGRQLAVYVALVQTDEALLEARQFETFHRLAAFLVHDLKNVSAQLSLISANAERHRDNPEFVADAFRTVGNARERLERTLAQLRKAQPGADSPRQAIEVDALLEEVAHDSREVRPVPRVTVEDSAGVLGNRDALRNVLLHLVRNAQEATPDNGDITMTLKTRDQWAIIEIEDNGAGMDEDFVRRRLFRPFQTTKGNAGMGIGLYEARDLVVRMGGRIDVSSHVGEGTAFTLRLPRYGT
ncbi:XrtA/PEP-CTERM system histidine kinase PrsK [Thioalkalivibrio sp. ALE28]|uniref:XrtA/PEP-CTERM system histidine kinase PrsK n=1 Tax=Thioalkalivibrio sp. ALE28 TaxID=1158179 RepID=UPI000366616D|nr:XrtA/PEP-CTERM system histidine kinase PrsK [Thioalkalivibrio sp. ALE28]